MRSEREETQPGEALVRHMSLVRTLGNPKQEGTDGYFTVVSKDVHSVAADITISMLRCLYGPNDVGTTKTATRIMNRKTCAMQPTALALPAFVSTPRRWTFTEVSRTSGT